jgi:hypothetical protein
MATTKKPERTKKQSEKSKSPKKTTALARANRLSVLRSTSRKSLIAIISTFVVLLVLILLILLWYYKDYNDPRAVFWNMVNNNLATKSVTKQTAQNNAAVQNSESIQLLFNPSPAIKDIKNIVDNSTKPPTRLKLEGVGTPNTDYQHYLLIDRPAADGKKKDYSKVYDMWLKNGDSAQLINSNLFGPLLFGNLPAEQREAVLVNLRNAYHVNFGAVKSKTEHGRRTYTYEVGLSLKDYAAAAQQYAKIYNLPIAGQIDPASYEAAAQVNLVVTIDALSSQVRSLDYKANNLVERYSSYGVVLPTEIPKKTVTSEEFQKALQSAEQ